MSNKPTIVDHLSRINQLSYRIDGVADILYSAGLQKLGDKLDRIAANIREASDDVFNTYKEQQDQGLVSSKKVIGDVLKALVDKSADTTKEQ